MPDAAQSGHHDFVDEVGELGLDRAERQAGADREADRRQLSEQRRGERRHDEQREARRVERRRGGGEDRDRSADRRAEHPARAGEQLRRVAEQLGRPLVLGRRTHRGAAAGEPQHRPHAAPSATTIAGEVEPVDGEHEVAQLARCRSGARGRRRAASSRSGSRPAPGA